MYFFFQAEDGIRDDLVTGVQTCALPISTGAGWIYEYALVDHTHKYSLADLRSLQDWHLRYQLETVPGVAEVATIGGFVRQYQVKLDRSEERRVGKECRSRGAPYH